MLRAKCGGTGDLLLVHILVRGWSSPPPPGSRGASQAQALLPLLLWLQVRKADPSRLVFIDNSGRPHQSADNLNFRLVEGINE